MGGGRACEAAVARAARFSAGFRTEGFGGHGAHAKRTENIADMSVTLDVSKVNGWLNANVFCRGEGRADEVVRGVGREAGGHV